MISFFLIFLMCYLILSHTFRFSSCYLTLVRQRCLRFRIQSMWMLADAPSTMLVMIRSMAPTPSVRYKTILVILHTHFLSYLTPDLKELLNPVPDAAYDSLEGVGGCLEGTRREVIGRIMEWIDGHNDQPICWLNGAAGFGKSAISRTIAALCEEEPNRLGASFFFWRGAGQRSVIANFISTLAYNLAFSVPETRPYIEKILLRNNMIIHRSPERQFQKLIVDPIQSVSRSLL